MSKKKLLMVPDIKGWVIDKMALGIKSVVSDIFDITIMYPEAFEGMSIRRFIKNVYDKFDILYFMIQGNIPKGLPDYSKIITTLHGGPATEGQADEMDRLNYNNMRTSYVSSQVKDRVTIMERINSHKVKVKHHFDSYDGNYYSQGLYGYSLTNLHFTPHGVNTEIFPYMNIKHDRFSCGYAGWIQYLMYEWYQQFNRRESNKSQEKHRRGSWIIKSCEEIGYELYVAGGMPGENKQPLKMFLESYIPEMLRDINNKLHISTRTPEQMPNFYSKLDVYLVPDKFAGGPMPVLEAGSMGVPIITTNCGLCGDIIKDGEHGIVVDTYKDFVEAIRWMQSHREERLEMGYNLSEYIKEHRTWEAVKKYWIDFFEGE